jgi:hypothetical protein
MHAIENLVILSVSELGGSFVVNQYGAKTSLLKLIGRSFPSFVRDNTKEKNGNLPIFW